MTRIDELKRACALEWWTYYELRQRFPNEKHMLALARAYAMQEALETVTGRKWCYSRERDEMKRG